MNNKRRPLLIFYTILLLNLFSLIKNASAQNKEHIFKNYSVNEGLSNNWVTTITQDKEGFVWIGTKDGLNRFDGNSFGVFKAEANNNLTIKRNSIESLYTDEDGQVWVGYYGGVSMYDNNKGYFINYDHNPKSKNTLVGKSINKIAGDKNGNIWIATYGDGISIFNKKSRIFTSLLHDSKNPESLSSNRISNIAIDTKGNAWIATFDKGLDFYNAKTKKIIHYGVGTNSAINSIAYISKIFIDSKDNIWLTSWAERLFIFDPINNKLIIPENIPKDVFFIDLVEDTNGDIWMGTENRGIYVYNLNAKSIYNISHNINGKYSLAHNSVYSIFIDKNKNFWFGTYAGGLSYYLSNNNKFGYYFNVPDNPNSLSNNSVICLEQSKENLFIGTDGGGLNKLNTITGEFTRIHPSLPGIKMDIIISMFNEDDKYLWIVLFREGIMRYNLETGELENFTKRINLNQDAINNCSSILIDKKKNLWIGTWGVGFYHFDLNKNKLSTFNAYGDKTTLSSTVIFQIMEDSQGNIWISTNNGLNLLENFEKGKFIRYDLEGDNSHKISNEVINMSFEDSMGNIWVASADGLNCIDKGHKKIKSYSTKDGLVNNYICAISEDNYGNLWISTNGGLSEFNIKNQTFKNYNHLDGLQGNQFNRISVAKIKNHIAFGGTNGMNLFNPYEININHSLPELYFTQLWVDDKKITPVINSEILSNDISCTNKIDLDYDIYKIKIDYVGVNFNNAYNNQYAYYLEGFDKSWTYTDKMSLNYTNLDPGKYLLHIKVSNDGTWNKNVKTLVINIRYPYWQTWWFISIELFFFGSLWFLSLYSKSRNSNKFISGVLTIFTLVATLELITTTVDSLVDFRANPVYTFLVNLGIAIVLMPLENILKGFIKKAKNKGKDKKGKKASLA